MEIIVKRLGTHRLTECSVGKDLECTEEVWKEWQCPEMISKHPDKLVTHGPSMKQLLSDIFSSEMVRGGW